ncbi:MAG: PAS domain S-box protein [Deltaproteobacteria bacterium]|nr:PAS domain S-box protein [Deltaproteobacteria bacterium]
MGPQNKEDERLTGELERLRRRVSELEMLEIERKQAQEALRESENRARALLDAPTESAILIDPDGRITAANHMAGKYLGMDVDNMIGKSIFDLLPPEVAQARNQKVFQVVESGKSIRFEDTHKGRFYDHNVYPILNVEGEFTQIAVYSRDVTDYRLAEAQLRQRSNQLLASEEEYRTLVENVPLVVYRLGATGQIAFINSIVEEIFGFTPDEILQNPWLAIQRVHNEDRARVEDLRNKSFKEGKEFLAEYRVKHKDGHTVFVSDHAIPHKDHEGSIRSVDGIMMDITGRMKMQEELVRSGELKTIGEISARLAHEIRNPLVSVGGFARRLLSSMDHEDPNRENVKIIVKEVGRLEVILKMILNYLHPIELQLVPTDLNRLLEKVMDAMATAFNERGVKISLFLDPELPVVPIDPQRFELVLEALAKQALNQMVEKETLYLRSSRESGIYNLIMRYKVQHISSDDIEHFFYPFTTSQMGSLRYDTADLPISKLVIDKHGGSIDVHLDQSNELIICISLPV